MKVSENEKVKLVTVKCKQNGQLDLWCYPNGEYVNPGDIVVSETGIEAVAITVEDYVDQEGRDKIFSALGVTTIPCIVSKYVLYDINWKED
jgi:hypothetical protein